MGNCIGGNIVLKELGNNFLKYNVIDRKHNIIIGTYFNTNKLNKSNIIVNQGISIGNNEINQIKFGIIHRNINHVELYFENNIKLIIIKEYDNKIQMLLSFNGSNIKKYIDCDIIKKYKTINDNSEYIDLIYDLTK